MSQLACPTWNMVLHPGRGGLAKCCPLEALEQLIGELVNRGWAGAWMIGPDEMERFGGLADAVVTSDLDFVLATE